MKRIYLITPNILTKKFYSFLPKVLASKKVKFLQLRCKSYSRSKIDIHLRKILTITKRHNVKLIINDDSFFVKKYKNTGFHLGQKDLMKKDNISNLNKNNCFGITCHNSISLAKKALKFKPHYIAFGAFYPTKTKQVKYIAKKDILKKAKKFETKVVAIGGITNKNYKELIKSGADYIAISSFIWKNKQFNPAQAIKLFK
ncbi:MAG: thiamine phosphate synthase [Pelagibacteraceae bacterium]|nr:thiamine phosphate synthase [Pelagibacteraceae bacterium]MCI5078908.1 thiamine phosphate synthase [Pelagibacteraceae bacterium]